MQRFLAMAAEAQVGGESLMATIKIAVLPIAKVFTMCFLGFLMASKYVNILPASGRKLLNGLVFSLLLPCLIFSQLGQAITLEKMIEWWFIPANVVLGTISGSLIGLVVAYIVRPPYPFFKFTIIQIGIGNIGNVPLVLIAALCRDKSNPFGDSGTCSTDGTAYISFGQWVGAIVLYTYVFNMLAPPPEGTFYVEEANLPIRDPPKDGAQIPKDDSPEQALLLTHDDVQSNSNPQKNGKMKQILVFLYEKLKLKQILQPPIIASILAMGLGVIPFFKKLIFTSDAPLFFLTDGCIILGEAMIPCILLALGGNLVDGPGSSKLGLRTTAAIIFARLLLVPPVGLGIVMLADKLGFLPAGDQMFRFVLLLQHTMPTSILSGAVANLRGCGREAAAVLFWVHIFAVLSMAGWITLYLNLLF
ncbi:protein PIN-LIKES 6 [Syzygium oleosum]|uniref:protein PIN-LIKES 6 n=1 Tax=Syzygium oleosum TaxID=219896 RepID=UPI0011D2009B|nr:protein PIN-LIKES 6 [Syzygium oleosum]XP_056171102.1 protein PIN-LIKES 6 [Syzygium oleosum]